MRCIAQVELTWHAWQQFAQMNRRIGPRFIRGLLLRDELAAYIDAHEARGIQLDTACQELRYDSGIYLLMMQHQGVWYITEIWTMDVPTEFTPVYRWLRGRSGWRSLTVRALIGWRSVAVSTCTQGRCRHEPALM